MGTSRRGCGHAAGGTDSSLRRGGWPLDRWYARSARSALSPDRRALRINSPEWGLLSTTWAFSGVNNVEITTQGYGRACSVRLRSPCHRTGVVPTCRETPASLPYRGVPGGGTLGSRRI